MEHDPSQYKSLLNAILKQAMDDYIKLQHPKFRTKKYLQEAFDSAVQLFFDGDFKFLHIENDEGGSMSLKDLVTTLLEDDRADVKKLKEHLVSEATSFWETKLVRTLYIPDSFIYDGHVYMVKHTDDPDPYVDFDTKEIYINKHNDSENELKFVQISLKVLFYHEEIASTPKKIEQLGKALFRMLKINSCFTGS